MKLVFLTVALISFSWTAGATAGDNTVDRILAKVGSDIITVSDTIDALRARKTLLELEFGPKVGKQKAQVFQKDLLNELILETVLKQAIVNEGIQVSDQDVEQEYQIRLQRSGMSERTLIQKLQNGNVSLGQYKEDIRFKLGKQRFVQDTIFPKIQISDKDLQDAYDKEKWKYKTYGKFRFTEVMLVRQTFGSEAEWKAMAKKIQQGLKSSSASTKALIKKHSSGAFKDTSGDSGIMAANEVNPQIKSLLDNLKQGETSQLFNMGDAIFIFKVTKKAEPMPLPYSQVANLIRMQLADSAIEKELRNYLMAMKDQTYVEIVKK